MLKYARSESGLTLVEVLAALLISAMVLGTASLVMFGASHLFDARVHHYNEQTVIKRTMNTLASQLSNSTRAIYFSDHNELRFLTGTTFKAAVFDEANNELRIYDFIGDGLQFINSDISWQDDPALYTRTILLTDFATDVQFYETDGETRSPLSTLLENGQLIEIVVTFVVQEDKMVGGIESEQVSISRVIKLLSENAAE